MTHQGVCQLSTLRPTCLCLDQHDDIPGWQVGAVVAEAFPYQPLDAVAIHRSRQAALCNGKAETRTARIIDDRQYGEVAVAATLSSGKDLLVLFGVGQAC